MTIDVERVDYIRVPVKDIEQAKQFYGEVLGLPQNPNSPADDRVEYEVGGNPILLHRRYAPYPDGRKP